MENSSVDSKRDYSWQQQQKANHLRATDVLKSNSKRLDTANRIKRNFKDFSEKKEWLAYVKYPGIVMAKRPSETKYLVHSIAQ